MTVIECMVPGDACSPQELFRVARWSSSWAKWVDPPTRAALYEIKDLCLARLVWCNADAIIVRGDQDRHRGLLSVALRSDPRVRLHTHEGWLPAA